MSGFVANGSHYATDIILKSDGFFPEIALMDIREIVSIDGSITDRRLKQITIEEMIDVNRLLQALTHQAKHLSALSSVSIDGKGDKEHLYLSAISNGIAAKINENKRKYDSSNAGLKKAEDIELTVDHFRQKKQWAVQQLLGENQTVVELI